MVTRVEVGSIASLRAGPGLGDISREEALKRTYFCQTEDNPGAPSTRILRAKSPLRTHLYPLPIAPKPFLKEQVPEKKAPVTCLWPGATHSCPSADTDKQEVKEDLAKKMPSLAGQEADRGETPTNGPSEPNKATFLRSGPSTMGLFETTKAESSLSKGTSERNWETSSQAVQASSLSARPEVPTKPALPARKPPVTLPRPTSLSQDAGSAVCQEEADQAQPLPKAHSVEDPAGQAPEAKPHPKRRPMSAVFSEYLQSPKTGPGGVAVMGKVPPPPPEKTWVRKPRPLSVDLTAVFENREMLLRKVTSEQSAAERKGPEKTSMEPKGCAEDPARMDATPQVSDSDFQEVAKKIHARREKTVPKQSDRDSPRTPRTRAIPGDDQGPQEEERPDQQSEKVLESPFSRPQRGLGLAEVKGGGSDQEVPAGRRRMSSGSIRKRLSLFEEESAVALAAMSEPSSVTPESPSTVPEPERASVNVQARIKGWTVENIEAKTEVRRMSQSRPLPTELTRQFSRSPSSNEVGYEKCALLPGELPEERREKPKEKYGLDGAPATGSPWKSGVPQKSRQTEPKDASDQDPDRCQRAHSAGVPGPSEVSPDDDGSFQKVWATVFEHHVERHTVVDQASHCLLPNLPHEVADIPDSKPRPEKGFQLGKDPPGVMNKRDHAAPGMLGHTVLVDVEPRQYSTSVPESHPMGERHSSHSVLRHPESSPVSQRIQPKYDIVHASGERAHSEAVSRVPEEKAVTLRRHRLSLQGRQLSQEVSPTHLECALQNHGGAVQRASSIWEARSQEISGPKLYCQQPRDAFAGSCPSSKWTGGVVASSHSTSMVSKDLSAPKRGPSQDGSSDPPSTTTIERCDSLVQARPNSLSLQKGPLAVASEDKPRLAQAFQPEVRMRRSNPSEPRIDRWRRRTLPHDVKFDAFSLLTPENASKIQQRPADDVTSPTCALKRPPLSYHQAQTGEMTPGASPSRTFPVEKPGPSAEPNATFFAVTYQIPDIQKAKSVIKPGPENVSEPSRRRTAPPLSPHSFVSILASPNHEEVWAPASSKGWAKGREYEEVKSFSKHPKATDQLSPAKDRVQDPSRDRIIDVDALQIHQGSEDITAKDSSIRASSGIDVPQTSPVLRRPKSLLVRRRTEVISETFPGKMRDGYRSGVLDIDALMAEYKEQSNRVPSKAQEQRNSSPEHSDSPQEKSGWPKEADWGRRSLKEASRSDSAEKQAGTSVQTPQSPGPSKQPAESLGAAMTTKSGLPLWAPPHLTSAETGLSPSPAPAGSRRKSPGTSEFESKPSSSEHEEAKHRQDPAKSRELDRISPRSPLSDQKKGTPKRSTGQGVEGNGVQWESPPRDCIWPPLDIKRACSEKGPRAKVQEGLSVMQDARQRRQEQTRGKRGLPTETSKATAGPCQKETRKPDGPKVPLQNPEQGEDLQDSQQSLRQVSPITPVPGRSHSFCKDKRSRPFVNQLKQCFSRRAPEAKDTDTLVHEADSQYGTWADQHQNGGRFGPESPSSPDSSATSAEKQPPSSRLSSFTESTSVEQHDSSRDRRSSSVDRSSSELESTDGPEGPPTADACPAETEDDFSFIHQTSVLDSSALKTRVQLSKRRRRRAPISHLLRRSQFSESECRSPLEEESHSAWMFKDSTEEKPPRRDESDEEPPKMERTPVSHPQRMPVFPGMDPAVLKAQLHKRPEVDSPGESPSWAPQPKTPKSPFQPGVLGSRVLPSSTDKDERSEESSPQWLKDLKSKKRQSLYDNQA